MSGNGHGSERIQFVIRFRDVPTEGIADFEGQTVYFHAEFDSERDEYSNRYELIPVDADLLPRVEMARQEWRKRRSGGAADELVREIRRTADRRDGLSVIRAVAAFTRIKPTGSSEDAFEVAWTRVVDSDPLRADE